MAYKVFKEMRLSRIATVPFSYSRTVRWLPQIGDVVPQFRAETTQGPIAFHDWAEGSWVFLFSHPAPFTPVCTTELASFAAARAEFEDRGVKLLGLSGAGLEDQAHWHAAIEQLYGLEVAIPMASDGTGLLADLFGMIHPEQSRDCTIRKSFIIGPDLKVRMIFEYPAQIGRSTEEVLRCIDALQTAERFEVAVGADWRKGDECLRLPDAEILPRAGRSPSGQHICSYLRTVEDPWGPASSTRRTLAV